MTLFGTDKKEKEEEERENQENRDSRANVHFTKQTILLLINITILDTMMFLPVSEFVREHQYDVIEH